MTEQQGNPKKLVDIRDKLQGPNPALETAHEAKGSYVLADGAKLPFHLWVSDIFPHHQEDDDFHQFACELFCLPKFKYRMGMACHDLPDALRRACDFLESMHRGEAAIFLDEQGRRMEWPRAAGADPRITTEAEDEIYDDGLDPGDEPNRVLVSYDVVARRRIDREVLDCPIKMSRQRFREAPGEYVVKVRCPAVLRHSVSYRRSTEAAALADCHMLVLAWIRSHKLDLEQHNGDPFDLPRPKTFEVDYPNLSTEEGRLAAHARVCDSTNFEMEDRSNFERRYSGRIAEE